MMSVIINTTGHNKTPAVKLKENSLPNNGILIGEIPKVLSNENIFTPITSAIKALAIKNPAKNINSLVDLLLMMLVIIKKIS
jgi:hypothetical protein